LFGHIRKFFWKPQLEAVMYEKIKAGLWSFFNKMAAQSLPSSTGELIRSGLLEKDEHNNSGCGFAMQNLNGDVSLN